VIGLGAIGVLVANAARALGMEVIGYDPDITVSRAWQLSAEVQQAHSVDEVMARSQFVSVHVPLVEGTKGLINAARLSGMPANGVILNFSRAGIVDDEAVVAALDEGRLWAYACDFPANLTKNHPRVITLPHLGASTREAEENCAVMVADQLRDFLENGNIRNSVNFPEVVMARSNRGQRLAIANANVPNMLGQFSAALGEARINIVDMYNKSRGELAYTLVDVEGELPSAAVERIRAVEGVLNVRVIA
jgi:D-3-phosphoglycerate dehydrogenase